MIGFKIEVYVPEFYWQPSPVNGGFIPAVGGRSKKTRKVGLLIKLCVLADGVKSTSWKRTKNYVTQRKYQRRKNGKSSAMNLINMAQCS